jgi:hypothetical protein
MSRLSFHKLQIVALSAIAVGTLYSCSAPQEKAPDNSEKPGNSTPEPVVAEKKPEPPKIRYPKPDKVKGIYVTAWTAGGQKRMEQLLKLLDETELNAMVIDIRDSGEMYFETGIPLAKQVGANQIGVVNPQALMDKLEKRGVYPIARIACFRDVFVPKKMPERGVQLPDGRPWRDHSGHTWLDPYNKKNWEYVAQTVEFALDLGFPEIQLDYVRFPSEGKASTQRFPGKKTYPDQKAKPGDVIAAFAKYVGEKVRARGAVYSADIFGIISSSKVDQGIGQTLEQIAEPFDLVCPMVYPSHYARGEYGIADPNSSPYAVVKKSLQDFKNRIPKKAVRPWLQDFSLGVRYGAPQVKAQIKASRELGYEEFLLWNASNRYTAGGVAKESKKKATVAVDTKNKQASPDVAKPDDPGTGAKPSAPATGG